MQSTNYRNHRRVIRLYSSPYSLCLNGPLFESNGPMYVVEPLIEGYDFERELITEGLGSGAAKDILQYIVSAAAEYGLGAVTMPAAGAGVAVGPGVETAIDAIFATSSISDAVRMVKNIASEVGEFADLFNEVIENAKTCVEKPEQFYESVKKILAKGASKLSKEANEKIEKTIEKVKKTVDKLLDKLTDALVKGVKVLIPDATASVAVSTGIRGAMETLGNNSYTALTSAVNKAGKIKEFLANPDKTEEFFSEIIDKLIELCEEFAKKIDKTGYMEMAKKALKLGVAAAAGSTALKKFGPDGLRKLAKFMTDKKPQLLEMIKTILTVLVPATYGVLAVYQIAVKGEYKGEADAASGEKSETKKESRNYRNRKALNESMSYRNRSRNKNEVDLVRWNKLAGILYTDLSK